jgi:hypothetical protein
LDFDLEAGGFTIVVILLVELWTLGIGKSDTRVDEVDFGCVRTIDEVDRY